VSVEAVLLDIEGTTTPIAFVTEVLFPYARTHLHAYLGAHASQPEHESLLGRLRDEHTADQQRGEQVPSFAGGPVPYIEWLMDRDRKSTALKELQGLICEEGYRRGELRAQVFPDVRPALERWRARQIGVGIYSSGSVLAQRLLFGHTADGDLTGLLRWHFDTHVGPKIDPASYRRIADAIQQPADRCLFLSDATRELDAARQAGLQVRLVVRPGNAPVPSAHGFETIHSLAEITTTP
jgi:enolase-phosphatase E1